MTVMAGTANQSHIHRDPEILDPDDGQQDRVRRGFWKTVAKAAGRIPFMEDVVAAYYCAMDPATPARVRATLMAALAYFVLPLDVIPDFIIGVGFGDDATVLMAAIAMLGAHINQ
jgi:uncharacterized membrane protein YkvA (DUF1232 family)